MTKVNELSDKMRVLADALERGELLTVDASGRVLGKALTAWTGRALVAAVEGAWEQWRKNKKERGD